MLAKQIARAAFSLSHPLAIMRGGGQRVLAWITLCAMLAIALWIFGLKNRKGAELLVRTTRPPEDESHYRCAC